MREPLSEPPESMEKRKRRQAKELEELFREYLKK